MSTIAIQYLEPGPDTSTASADAVRAHLRAACAVLPVDYVLIGWDIPAKLLDLCAEESARAGAKLMRWHPLLSGDGTVMPRPEWQVIGLNAQPVPGFQDMPEFTFMCPNHAAVRNAVFTHLQKIAHSGVYAGIFLDRMRFPSPATNPETALACFCEQCRRAAAAINLDLDSVRQTIQRLLSERGRVREFLQRFGAHSDSEPVDADLTEVDRFLEFRRHSITRFVAEAAQIWRRQGLEIGLDSFSPALTNLVGQDLGALDAHCDWIKIMSYGHALGPAGLPFELLGIGDWLVDRHGFGESEAMEWLAAFSGLSLPKHRTALRKGGLAPAALAAEARRGREAKVRKLLFGIELNDVEGVTHLNDVQIGADLRAIRETGVDGLVCSWDLRHMSIERLELVSSIWFGN